MWALWLGFALLLAGAAFFLCVACHTTSDPPEPLMGAERAEAGCVALIFVAAFLFAAIALLVWGRP